MKNDDKIDIHKLSHRYKLTLERLERAKISKKNKEKIREFIEQLSVEDLSLQRKIKLISMPVLIFERYIKKNWDEVTKSDVKHFIASINESKYSPWTKKDYRTVLKKFISWVEYGENYKEKIRLKGYPEKVSFVNTTLKKKNKPRIDRNAILNTEEIEKIINAAAAENPRDAAFISLLYELGARISELGNLSYGSISKDEENFYVVDLHGKTGHRTPRVVLADKYITRWLNTHPTKENSDPLWLCSGVRDKIRPLHYNALKEMVKRVALRAGITKRIYCHLFRHTRITHLLSQGMTDAQVKNYVGLESSSDQLATYSHLVIGDANAAVLKLYGIESNGNGTDKHELKPKICGRCSKTAELSAKYCECGYPLIVEAVTEVMEKNESTSERIDKLEQESKQTNNMMIQFLEKLGYKDIEKIESFNK